MSVLMVFRVQAMRSLVHWRSTCPRSQICLCMKSYGEQMRLLLFQYLVTAPRRVSLGVVNFRVNCSVQAQILNGIILSAAVTLSQCVIATTYTDSYLL